ncbi:MAG: VCBS repeat-containing protein [Minicystis sp.]
MIRMENLTSPNDVAAGDLDGDGAPDLAIAMDSYLKVLWNQGDGTFVEHLAYGTSSWTRAVLIGDFDGDGLPDVVTGGFDQDGAQQIVGSVALLRGSDGFATPTSHVVPHSAERLAAGDLDGDGRPDLVVVSPGHPIGVMRNTGAGFTDEALLPVDADGAVLADLDGDGRLDIVATRAGAVTWLRNTGGAVFAAPVDFPGVSNAWPAAGDLDGDGRPDVVLAAPYTTAVGAGWVGVMFDRCLP